MIREEALRKNVSFLHWHKLAGVSESLAVVRRQTTADNGKRRQLEAAFQADQLSWKYTQDGFDGTKSIKER